MKQKTFVIRDAQVLSRLVAFIEAQPAKPVIECIVRDHRKQREVIQNSLYWRWLTVIAYELGVTKEDVHYDCKKRMLVPIYERDDSGYAEMLYSIRRLYKHDPRDGNALFDQIVKLTSTTNATVKQFAEYLTEIERDMMGKGIALPHKEDQYWDALMINKPAA